MKSVLLLLSLTTGLASSIPVIGYEGGSVEIHCSYQYKASRPKYFCKPDELTTCTELIRTAKKEEWESSGRFYIYNARDGLRVIIRNLTREDAGNYRCGVDEGYGVTDTTTDIKLTVRDGQTSVQLTGVPGDPASVTCTYPPEHKDFVKFFCREDRPSTKRRTMYCKDKVILWKYKSSERDGRFTLTDNEKDRFTVKISGLAEDTGTYWCGVRTRQEEAGGHYWSYMQQVPIAVKGEGLKASFPVIGLLGGTTTITCDLGDRYYDSDNWKAKYVCRRTGNGCTQMLRLAGEGQQVESGWFSLEGYGETRIIIQNLTKEDEGTYLCGEEEEFGADQYNEVTLSVTTVAGQRFVEQTGQPGRNFTFNCFYPAALNQTIQKSFSHKRNRGITLGANEMSITDGRLSISDNPRDRSITDGRLSISDNPRDNLYSVTIANLTDWDAGVYSCYIQQYEASGEWSAPRRFRSSLNQVQLNFRGLTSSFSLIGSSGGNAAFVCSSPSSSPKYFCRWAENRCTELIRTDRLQRWENSGRFSIMFITEIQTIAVIFRDLKKEDAGIYRLGVEEPHGSYCEMNLDVKNAMPSPKPVHLAGNLGKDTSVICSYPAEYSGDGSLAEYSDNSYRMIGHDGVAGFGFGFCKQGNDGNHCRPLAMLRPNEKSTKRGRFSMTDNQKNHYFTVAISNLTEEDLGTYWCGMYMREDEDSEIRFWSYPTKVIVTDELEEVNPQTEGMSTEGMRLIATELAGIRSLLTDIRSVLNEISTTLKDKQK